MISASLQQRKTRTRRSMLFVPGANAAMVSNSFIYPADALMFDLEDSVALREKDTARRLVYHALQHPLYHDVETIVRVNALDSEWGINDLEAVVRGGADVVRLPKTDTAQDVIDIESEILRIEKACGREPGSTGLLAAIESPLGITRAVEIAHELDPSLELDGELQLDAAIVPSVGESKAPGSRVAGHANVLIFPCLTSSNSALRIVQRLGGAESIGPILLGTAAPAHVLTTSSTVRRVVNMTALAVAEAQARKASR